MTRRKPTVSKKKSRETAPSSENLITRFALVFPLLLAVAVFWQVTQFDFVNHDEPFYIYNNPSIQQGLTPQGIRWAFCADLCFDSPNADYWQPVTMLSRMIDIEFWKLNPHGHHFTNLLLHLANVLLLYFIFLKLSSRNHWLAAWIAAAFAVHPAQGDVVAWVTARKDVLSIFFGFGTILAYLWYAEKTSRLRYGAVLLAYALSLMSKPMFLTMPALLLILDYWPLERWKNLSVMRQSVLKLILEKWGLFFLAGVSAWITLFTHSGAVLSFLYGEIPITILKYLRDFIWPTGFSVQEALSDARSLWETGLAGILVAFITFIFIRARHKYLFLTMGWLWFLVGLVPVLAIPHMARYLPLSGIGLSVMMGWGFLRLSEHWKISKQNKSIIACFLLCVWAILSFIQTRHWRDSLSLGEYSVRVHPNSALAHSILAVALLEAGRVPAAADHFAQGIKLLPQKAELHVGLALTLEKEGRREEAVEQFKLAIQLEPLLPRTYNTYGVFLAEEGKCVEAIQQYEKALSLDSEYVAARLNLGQCLLKIGKKEAAIFQFKEAIRINPGDEKLHNNLAAVMVLEKRWDEALDCIKKVLDINPNSKEAQLNLQMVQNIKANRKRNLS